jgi:hypothetical protein
MVVGRTEKGDHVMLKLKARTFSLIALTAALSLVPLSASAETGTEPAEAGFMVQLEEQIMIIVDTLQGIMTDVGPRMDDNG